MKQTALILALFFAFFVACGVKTNQETAPVDVDSLPVQEQAPETMPSVSSSISPASEPLSTGEQSAPEEVNEQEDASPAPLAKQVPPEVPAKMSPELRDLLSNADQKVKSYKYLYSISKDNRYPHTYLVKGTRMKIQLFEVDPYYIENYYDRVYLDAKTKTARGFCESKSRCAIRDIDNTNKMFNVSYTDYRVRTPYEFLKEITHAEIIGSELIENRQAVKVRQYDGNIMTDFWLDANYGMPRKIIVTKDDTVLNTYNFADMTFNSLSDDDVWRDAPKEES